MPLSTYDAAPPILLSHNTFALVRNILTNKCYQSNSSNVKVTNIIFVTFQVNSLSGIFLKYCIIFLVKNRVISYYTGLLGCVKLCYDNCFVLYSCFMSWLKQLILILFYILFIWTKFFVPYQSTYLARFCLILAIQVYKCNNGLSIIINCVPAINSAILNGIIALLCLLNYWIILKYKEYVN